MNYKEVIPFAVITFAMIRSRAMLERAGASEIVSFLLPGIVGGLIAGVVSYIIIVRNRSSKD